MKQEVKETINSDLIPNKILDVEKQFYHVLFVNGFLNKETLEVDYSVDVQIYDSKGWEDTKVRLQRLGYLKVLVLHDPNKGADVAPTVEAEPVVEAEPKVEDPKISLDLT